MKTSYDIAVIGGGAAGFFAAINAADQTKYLSVAILEGSHRLLTKVKISGGGRCNVTHACFEPSLLVQNYPRGSKQLRGPFTRFQPKDTIAWFAKRGVAIQGEDDGRMFPTTNTSQTIINCLMEQTQKLGIDILKGHVINGLEHQDTHWLVHPLKGQAIKAKYAIMATGSSPAGHKLLSALGQPLVSGVPSLFTFEIDHPFLKEMAGQSLPQVELKLKVDGKKFEQRGPMLITHWGLSGPAVLKLSAHAARHLHSTNYQADLRVNFAPGFHEEKMVEHLRSLQEEHASKLVTNTPAFDFSKRLWRQLLDVCNISTDVPWNQLAVKSLRKLAQALTGMDMQVNGKGVFKEEFVTCGGVALKHVDFRTMESKLFPNLFFAGEVLDIDGITGGFNFQNAWTTGWIAAQTIVSRE